jgi:hypothetical protein
MTPHFWDSPRRVQKPIHPAEGRAAAAAVNAAGYYECSVMQRDVVNEMFDLALKTALKPKKGNKGCILL